LQRVTTAQLDPEIRKQKIWYQTQVQKGIDDMEAGREISHEEMAAWLKAKGVNVVCA